MTGIFRFLSNLSISLIFLISDLGYSQANTIIWRADWNSLPVESALPLLPASNVPRDHGPVSKTIVDFQTNEKPGTIIISNSGLSLHHVLGGGKAARYKISVGRDGFSWTGTTVVGRKAEWPDWRPPTEMRKREPNLPALVPAGPFNPLGARAIYLFQNGKDTLYRIHGTNNSASIGGFETSGCFRLSNSDALELYGKIKIGSKVIVKK